jgi:hypothetical protein
MTKNYQECFNNALSKMRIATGAILMDNEPLMRTLVKIMYDFSDDLKHNGIIRKDKQNDTRTNKIS